MPAEKWLGSLPGEAYLPVRDFSGFEQPLKIAHAMQDAQNCKGPCVGIINNQVVGVLGNDPKKNRPLGQVTAPVTLKRAFREQSARRPDFFLDGGGSFWIAWVNVQPDGVKIVDGFPGEPERSHQLCVRCWSCRWRSWRNASSPSTISPRSA